MWCWWCFCRRDGESETDDGIVNVDNNEQCPVERVHCVETSITTSDLDGSRSDQAQNREENNTLTPENSCSNGVYKNKETAIGDSSWLLEQYVTSVGSRNYYGADFKRWLRNDVIYIKTTFDCYKSDVLKTIETTVADYNNAYQEFELFASWKKEVTANQTTVRDSHSSSFVHSNVSYAQILRSDPSAQRLSNVKSISCSQIVTSPEAEYSSETGINNQPQYAGNLVARVVLRCKRIPSETTSAVISKQNQSYPLHRNIKERDRYLNKVEIIKCTNNGYIINKEVHLLAKNWHMVLVSGNGIFCLLCNVTYYDKHIHEQNHLRRLHWSVTKILNKGSNIVRELVEDTLYHCGICNVAIRSMQEMNFHIYSQTHRDKFFASRNMCRKILRC